MRLLPPSIRTCFLTWINAHYYSPRESAVHTSTSADKFAFSLHRWPTDVALSVVWTADPALSQKTTIRESWTKQIFAGRCCSFFLFLFYLSRKSWKICIMSRTKKIMLLNSAEILRIFDLWSRSDGHFLDTESKLNRQLFENYGVFVPLSHFDSEFQKS